MVLFPDRFRGQFCALHRPTGATPFTAPEMWIAWSHDLESWGNHEPLLVAKGRPGPAAASAPAPPIRVDDGWLVIYHGSRRSDVAGRVGQYVAAAMLLDAERPARIIAQGAERCFVPTEPFEREGFVPDVVFPTGTVHRGDKLLVYYGASDTFVGVAELSLSAILKNLGRTALIWESIFPNARNAICSPSGGSQQPCCAEYNTAHDTSIDVEIASWPASRKSDELPSSATTCRATAASPRSRTICAMPC